MLMQMDIEATRFFHAGDFPTTLHASNQGPYFARQTYQGKGQELFTAGYESGSKSCKEI